jgi:ABC-2 type transport system permease protein
VDRDHLRAILWLRWRLSRNQWARSGGIGGIVAAVIGVAAVITATCSLFIGFLVGDFALAKSSPEVVSLVWLGTILPFLFFWTVGLISELQRSESIDIHKLMHLPVSLRQVFAINYLVSHYSVSIVLFVPGMIGLATGLAVARGAELLLLIPLSLGSVFMVSAWTYCFRGWIAAAMTNPRRRRSIIVGVTIAFVALAQGPNLYFNVLRPKSLSDIHRSETKEERAQRRREANARFAETLDKATTVEKFVPPLWIAAAAPPLMEHRPLPALGALIGLLCIGLLGLERAYAGTIRFYRGVSRASPGPPPAATSRPSTRSRDGQGLLEIRLPWVSDETSATAAATLRSMLRAPELKLVWGLAVFIPCLIGPGSLFRLKEPLPENVRPLVASGTVAFATFLLVQMFGNQFGFDRDGFRAVVLSPVERRSVLLGKNIATLFCSTLISLVPLAVASILLKLGPGDVLAAIFQLATLGLLAAMAGNVLSIWFPYRFAPGSLKPTKLPAASMLALVGSQMTFPILVTPVFLPPLAQWGWRALDGAPAVPVNLLTSILLASLVGAGYWLSLDPLSRFLRKRETVVLARVTAEVE